MADELKPKKLKLDRTDTLGKMLSIIAAYRKQGLTLTVRQLYYRLVASYGLKNCLNSYQFVGDVLRDARLDGTIPFESIEDRTRAIHTGESDEESVSRYFRRYWDYLQNMEENYDMPRWWHQPQRVIVVVEKQAMQGVFQSVTDRYGVDLVVNKGYPSLTLMWNLANRMKSFGMMEGTEELHIIYFGDFDPSGMDMDRRVTDTLSSDFHVDFDLLRIAITKEQIDKWHISPAPAKKGDSRRIGFILEQGVDWQVELDAIEPAQLQGLIKTAINKHFDPDVYNKERYEELQKRRDKMEEWADEWLNPDFVPPESGDSEEEEEEEGENDEDDEGNDDQSKE